MAGKLYKKKSIKKRQSSSKYSSKKSSKRSHKVKPHRKTVRKTRVKSHYRMKGMGQLLQMYGGAAEELEIEHNACLTKYKELIAEHLVVKQIIDDLRADNSSKSKINEQIKKANDIRASIEDLVDGAGKCKEKQTALLESLKDVTHNVTEQLKNEIPTDQVGSGFAEFGAKLDSAHAKLSSGIKSVGSKLSSGMKSVGSKLSSGAKSLGSSISSSAGSVGSSLSSGLKSVGSKLSSGIKTLGSNIKEKYGEYKYVQNAKKDAQERIQLKKLLDKHGSSSVSDFSSSSRSDSSSE